MTRPLMTRSQRLPRAPPNTRERAMAVAFKALPFLHSRAETTARAASENMISMATFHSDGDSAKRPKAAPWFCTWVRRNMPGTTSMLSCSVIFCDTSHFVIRSQRTIKPAIMMWYLRIIIQLDDLPGPLASFAWGPEAQPRSFMQAIRFQALPGLLDIAHIQWHNARFLPHGLTRSSNAHTFRPGPYLPIRATACSRSPETQAPR